MSDIGHNQLPLLVDRAVEAAAEAEKCDELVAGNRRKAVEWRLEFGSRCIAAKKATNGGWTKAREAIQTRTGWSHVWVNKLVFLAGCNSSYNLSPDRILELGGINDAYTYAKRKEEAEKARAAAESAKEQADEETIAELEAEAKDAEDKAEIAAAPTAVRDDVKARKRDEKKEREASARLANPAPDDGSIWHGSIADYQGQVQAGSLDAVFTDPPYPAEFLSCWSDLAAFAVHALKPGGVLLAVSGHMHLPEVLDRLRVEGLTYRWIVAYTYPKARARMHSRGVSAGWKPILAFSRDGARYERMSNDVFHAAPKSGADKADHEWGQTEPDMETIAREWTEPGWKVCDPFCGAGALLVGARNAQCFVTGCDIDLNHVLTTRRKLA